METTSSQQVQFGCVLLILKDTCLRTVHESRNRAERLRQLSRGVDRRAQVEAADAAHEAAVLAVQQTLTRLGIKFKCVRRKDLGRKHFKGVDLVITLGGDGTFLTSSHFVSGIPMLGVNSDPKNSHGKFCLTDAASFETIFRSILMGTLKPHNLLRLQLLLDGQPLSTYVLNEILVHDEVPPGGGKYDLDVNGVQERHVSSGVYVSTPAGCTGSTRSAGGHILPLTSGQWQYFVREPFIPPGENWQLLNGILSSDDRLVITSEMWDGWIYVDGKNSGIKYPFPRGAQLQVRPAPLPVIAYVNPAVNDRYGRILRQ